MYIHHFEDVVKQLKPFLSEYLQEHDIDTTKNFRCLFPEHEDKTPSANLVGDNDERFYCHSCSKSGDLFDAVQILENKPKIGIEWIEGTLKYLAEKYGIEIKVKDLTEDQIYELDTYRAYKAATALITPQENNVCFSKEIEKRGWDNKEFLIEQNIGTVSSYDDFYNSLVQQGFARSFLREIDLARKDLFNPDNLIFTWKDEKGRPIGFTARNLKYEQEKAEANAKGHDYKGKKYNNQRTTGLRCNIFQKGKRLYGIYEAIKASPPLYIFEGQADVITARNRGLNNCVAIAGSTLHERHIHLLKQIGIYDVVLALDGDQTGQRKLEETLETKFAGNRDMKIRVVIMPEDEDPDSFIRKNGIDAFKKLALWTAFEWRLNQYVEEADESDICQQMIPFIVNEPSPVVREKLCKILAKRTGIGIKTINEELNILLDARAHQRSRERQGVIDNAIYELRNSPLNAEMILQNTQGKLLDLTKVHNSDRLSNEDFVRALDEQKENEEKLEINDTGYKLGSDLNELEEIFRGDWSEGSFICFGGRENCGKSAVLSKLAYSIANYNKNAVVIYHTIDDTFGQLTPRFITIAEGSRKLSINMVRQPIYWKKVAGLNYITSKREIGYKKVRKLAQEGRLIVKDLDHGGSLPFAENIICYFQDKFPDRKIVYVLDNFHKLRDFNDAKDERVRFKALSEATKSISIRRHCCIISSVEYTKLPPGIKPTNNNIAESQQIAYDATAIIHLYSDLTDKPESFTVCHQQTNWQGNKVFLPRVEFIVGKNKITEQKRSFFLDFWPASSDYRAVDQKTVLRESNEMKEMKNNGSLNRLDDDEMGKLF